MLGDWSRRSRPGSPSTPWSRAGSYGTLVGAMCAALSSGCVRAAAGAVGPRAGEGEDSSDVDEGRLEASTRPSAVFTLNGQPFCFAGTNNYYMTYKPREMADDVLASAKAMGLRVVRIWAFLDRGSLDGTTRNVDGPGDKDGVYFQYWDPAKKAPAYNDGPTGLEHLDYVLDRARALDLKVVLVLTNNWKDFGGIDQVLVWYGLPRHEQFYTEAPARQAYENWAKHLVLRKNTRNGLVYRDDPTIFAWELGNEPRCTGSDEFGSAENCSPETITAWAAEMSSYVKSIDPNHLISVGDEGFFAKGHTPRYDGADGVDHAALLALPHVDFGTFHLYPEAWGQPLRWASQWIQDHLDVAQAARKPTLLEEYGVMARRDTHGAIVDDVRRRRAYARWHDVVNLRGGDGGLFWMLSGVDRRPDAVAGRYPDYDHFALYASDGAASLVRSFAASMASGAQACRLYARSAGVPIPKSPFVGTAPPP
jgi:mannan endo-1,4-beta-mannosidase